LNNTIISWVIKFLAKMLNGKKAYIGAGGEMLTGVSSIIVGITGIIGYAYPDLKLPAIEIEYSLAAITAGAGMITDGFKGIGLRHGIEKITAENRAEDNLPPAN